MFVPPELRGKLEKEAADTAKAKAEADKAAAEAGNIRTYGSATRPSFEQKTVTLDGRPNSLVNFDPKSGQMFLPGSSEPIAPTRVQGNPAASIQIHNDQGRAVGDFSKSGEEFLATIPVQWRRPSRRSRTTTRIRRRSRRCAAATARC
jgi:hypothetical protein